MHERLVPALHSADPSQTFEQSRRLDRTRAAVAARAKRGLDLTAVSVALLLFSPLVIVLVGIVALFQGRPILFRQKRIGRQGMTFSCLKFRTMVVNGDEVLHAHIGSNPDAADEWARTRKLKNDPRITPLGQVMRKLSLDELPQLLNVLKGEMSLVGPRPIVADEVHHYGAHFELYQSVRPGLTGPWQIGGRNDVSYSQRVELDADYVTNWSLGRDVAILIKTIPAVVTSRGCY